MRPTLKTKITWLTKTLKLRRAPILRKGTSLFSSRLCLAGPSSIAMQSESMMCLLPTIMAKSLCRLQKKVRKKIQIGFKVLNISSLGVRKNLIDSLNYKKIFLRYFNKRGTK